MESEKAQNLLTPKLYPFAASALPFAGPDARQVLNSLK
jgi:hypothetical protein